MVFRKKLLEEVRAFIGTDSLTFRQMASDTVICQISLPTAIDKRAPFRVLHRSCTGVSCGRACSQFEMGLEWGNYETLLVEL